jgi:predicted amidohydrolase YtcJ
LPNRTFLARLAYIAVLTLCAHTLHAAPPTHGTDAELILAHGRIYTLNAAAPWAEAVAISQGKIIAIGSDSEVLRHRTAGVQVIDLKGRLLTPGLIDSHVHFVDGGWYLINVPLRDATTMAEVSRRVSGYAATHRQTDWIQGEGWSYGYADLPHGEYAKEIIDKVSGAHPVFLDSSMAHAAWVNSEALRRAGITRDTPNPAGGEIVHGANGEPTGWLKEEAAIKLVQDKIPEPKPADTKAALLAAIHEANRLGLTRVDSAGGDFPLLPLLDDLRRHGQLTLRISIADWINPPGLTAKHLAELEAAHAHHRGALLTCCVAKFLMDGVIESHTAYLPGGYADRPQETGMRFFEPDAYKASVLTLNQHGIQVYTHAIGDGAIKLALDAYDNSQSQLRSGGRLSAAPRNRIEHAEAPDPEDIPRFGALDVIPSMQPLMIYPRDEWKGMEGLWRQYAGDRFMGTAFAIRSLLDSHATVAFGTDWPVVQLNPLLGIRNAVLRQSLDGQPVGGYTPEQRITVAEALRAYTLDAAYASRADSEEGSIAVGKRADMAVFSKNFVELPADEIAQAKVLMTLVGGRIVYREGMD